MSTNTATLPAAILSVAPNAAFETEAKQAVHSRVPADRVAAVRFLRELGRSLGTYGASANRLEDALRSCARALGVDAEFFATPTGVFVTVASDDGSQTLIAPINSSEVNLEKLAQLDRVLSDVVTGELDMAAASQRVRDIERAPVRYGAATTLLAFTLTSASAAMLFSGSWADIGAAAFAGLVIGIVTLGAAVGQSSVRLLEFASGAIAAVLGALAATALGAHPATVTLAGLIVLVPGLTVTTAMNELATRHLVAGSARLMGALIVFVMLGFGVAVGERAAEAFGWMSTPTFATAAPAEWMLTIPLAIIAFPLMVLFKAAPRDWIWITLATLIGFVGARLGAEWIGPGIGAGLGALLVGLAANSTARLLDRPAAIMAAPGILLLVPGSFGYRSIAALMDNEALAGIETAFNMLLIAASIVTGLLMASLFVPPRKAL